MIHDFTVLGKTNQIISINLPTASLNLTLLQSKLGQWRLLNPIVIIVASPVVLSPLLSEINASYIVKQKKTHFYIWIKSGKSKHVIEKRLTLTFNAMFLWNAIRDFITFFTFIKLWMKFNAFFAFIKFYFQKIILTLYTVKIYCTFYHCLNAYAS